MPAARTLVKRALPRPVDAFLTSPLDWVRVRSLRAALREQGLAALEARLAEIVPDISRQYSEYGVDSEYMTAAVRGLHAFQVELANRAIAIARADGDGSLTIVDIGDSAGTHLRYLTALNPDLEIRGIGVNLDPEAVARIRAGGLEAVEARAEDLAEHGIEADVFMSFETLEHVQDPIRALRDLSYRTSCRAFVMTVPYVPRTRVGLFHIRTGRREHAHPETTHVFELSPPDWRLVLQHAGWAVVEETTYLQYPRRRPLRATQPLWARTEQLGTHEGFWGAILRRDHSWSDLYSGW
ncbi:MAG: class I SAM-dependent methyltransferase [Thermoleophilaceae bacterium]